LPALVRELLALKVDVVLAVGGLAARIAKEATTTTPIVFIDNTDPAATGLVQSLARPGATSPGC